MARPTKYTPSFCNTVIDLGKQGASKAEMAVACGIGRDTFIVYQQEHPEFSDAVKAALQHSQAWWEQKGRVATFESQGFNATSYIFNMKNRFPEDWRDKVETDSTVRLDGRIIASEMTPEEASRLYKEMLNPT